MRISPSRILCIFALSLLFTAPSFAEDVSFGDNFVDAADTENLTALKSMIKAGKPVDSQGAFQTTALMRAAYRGNRDIVKYLLNAGADANLSDIGGATALHLATRQGHAESAKLLLDYGAEVDAVDGEGWTPLMRAALTNKPELIDLLIKKGADVNATNDIGETALMHAVMSGSVKVVEKLIYHGANISMKNKEGQTAADIAYQKGDVALQKALSLSSPVAEPASDGTAESAPTISIASEPISTELAETPPTPATVYLLQLGTFTDAEEATARWSTLRKEHHALLDNLSLVLSQVRLQQGSSFYRTQAGYLSDKAKAQALCTELYNEGVDCFVVESGMADSQAIQPGTTLPPAPKKAEIKEEKAPAPAPAAEKETATIEIVPEAPKSISEKPVSEKDYIPIDETDGLPWRGDKGKNTTEKKSETVAPASKPVAAEATPAPPPVPDNPKVTGADGMAYEAGREPKPLSAGTLANIEEVPAGPVSTKAGANAKSEVQVAEAIRVPLSSAAGSDLPPAPRPSLLPSRSSNKRTTWLQIGTFSSEDVAALFWDKVRQQHVDLANGLRFRTSRPFRSRGGNIMAQVGPMTSEETVMALCNIAQQHKLRCSSFEDIGYSAAANRSRPRSAEFSRPRASSISPQAIMAQYWIQFGSHPSTQAAEEYWKTISTLNADLLGSSGHRIAEPRYGSNPQPVYRLRSGPYVDRPVAHDICARMKLRQVQCLVVRE